MLDIHSSDKISDERVKVVAVLGYFTLVGWIIAVAIYGNHHAPLARFHLRQSLGLFITFALLSFIPLVGWVLALGVCYLWALGLYYALTMQKRTVPLIGDFFQQQLPFIE